MADKDAKHPDVHPGTPQEKAEDAKNLVALRPRQTLYLKIRAYCPIETDKSDAFLDAVDVFERACRQADLEVILDVTVTPMEEAQEKREAKRREQREAQKRELRDKREKAAPHH